MLRSLLFLLLLSPLAVLADLDFSIAGRPYRLVTTPLAWDAAEADAISKGGHLVHIENQDENDRLLAAIQAAGVTTTASDGGGATYVWIGGKETAEGAYAWADDLGKSFWNGGKTGTAPAGFFVNWGRGTLGAAGPEPDDFNNTQDRAAMGLTAWPISNATKLGEIGQWNDVSQSNTLAYIIEFDGIWASIAFRHGTTAMGTVTAKLRPDVAPIAVANFVGLAEGWQTFIDEAAGKVAQRPYYDGLICHRIISGFMIQGGCPRGNGTSGPGYAFPDEFSPTLRHATAGKLSMANSGPSTNGSQFFITVAPTTWLNDLHTLFGEVVDGYSSVALPLSNVAVTNESPNQPVVIDKVTIHRAGAAARAINATTSLLPVLSMLPATPSLSAEKHCLLNIPRSASQSYSLLTSENLQTWTMFEDILLDQFTPSTSPLDTFGFTPLNSQRHFYRVIGASSKTPLYAPASLQGRTLTVTTPSFMNVLNLTGANTGSFTLTAGTTILPGTILNYLWEPDAWGGRLRCFIGANDLTLGGQIVRFFDIPLRYLQPTSGSTNHQLQNASRTPIGIFPGTFGMAG